MSDLISRSAAIEIIRSMTISLGGNEIFHPEAKKSVLGVLGDLAAVDAEACSMSDDNRQEIIQSMSDDEFKAEAKRRGYNLIKKQAPVKRLPCVCGSKRTELWSGAGRTEFYVCALCGLQGKTGKSDRAASILWNEAVKERMGHA